MRFQDDEYHLIIVNAGAPTSYSLDETVRLHVTVNPDSSAHEKLTVIRGAHFLSMVDRRHWSASGSPQAAGPAQQTGFTRQWTQPPGTFGFTPKGLPLTFHHARNLPTNRPALARELARLLGGTDYRAPPAAVSARQYAFLLATAPLTHELRLALLEDLALLPGVHLCSGRTRKTRAETFCFFGSPTSTQVVIDHLTGLVTEVRERLTRATPLYANVKVGTVVDSDAFSLQRR